MTQTDQDEQQQQQQQAQQGEPQPQQQSPSEEKASMDKKEIAEEEREKMLNAENTKHTGAPPNPELEADEHKPKRKIPIGAIKMPGFCRSKSKEPCKEDESKPAAEGTDADVAKDGAEADKSSASKGRRERILSVLNRIPGIRVINARKEQDSELGATGQAGLASVETLEEADKKNAESAVDGDGMETVRLDAEAGDSAPVKPSPLIVCIAAARRNIVASAATLFILFMVLVIILFACVGPRPKIAQPVRDGKVISQTSCGLVQGLVEEDAFVFRGIPYAVPPVNNRRWQPSEELRRLEHCWNGTYHAHNSSNMCWQRLSTGNQGSEDCLYLDVYTPKVLYERPLPVVVLIGADTLSGPSPGILQTSGKVARVFDVVFVRPNFRLDVFGFLSVEPLSRSAHPPSSGNYGLSDIITALKWVQLNIEHFGGNKRHVTIWGHRAGGTLVTALVGSRKAKDLFQHAWISSGSAIFPTRELQDSEKQNEGFLANIKCQDTACLKSKKAEDVMDAVPSSWYSVNDGLPESKEANTKKHGWLVKDDIIIQNHIGSIFSSEENKLPVKVIMGTTAQSGQLPRFLNYNTTVNPEQIKKMVSESLIGTSGLAEKAINTYNATLKGLHTMISDVRVVCPLLTVAVMNKDIPFYVSVFPRIGNVSDADADAAAILGFFSRATPEQKRHLQAIQAFFKHFVWHGAVDKIESGKKYLIIDQDVNANSTYDTCDLWIKESFVPKYGRVD